jgi:hypothetical protein
MSVNRVLQRCKSYRRSWAAFLKDIIPPEVWRAISGLIDWPDDDRRRWYPRQLVLALLMMGWSSGQSLKERFEQARMALIGLSPKSRRPGNSYVGLMKAAQKFGVKHFQQWWKLLRPHAAKRLTADLSPLWPGPVLAVDGSRFDAPRTSSNERALGRAGRDKSGPQWWVTWLVQLPGVLLWDWRQGPGTSSEREHLQQMLADVPPEALIVGDAGFVGYSLLSALQQQGRKFLIRCGGNVTLLVPETQQSVLKKGQDQLVYLWPQNQRQQQPLELRLIQVGSGETAVYLLTNVLESLNLSRSQAGQLYRQRWGVEVGYRHLKQTLDRRRLLSESASAGAVELSGSILALALLLLQAAVILGRRSARTSVAAALRIIRQAMTAVSYGGQAKLWRLASAVGDQYQRHRPKQSRDYPRKKKERPPGSPKCRRITEALQQEITAMLQHKEAVLS